MKPLFLYSLRTLVVLALTGCAQPPPPSEADLRGAWQHVRPSTSLPEDIRFGKLGNQLILQTYHQQYEAALNQRGDTLTLQHGCLPMAVSLTLHRGTDRRKDTLVIEGFGQFSRMSWQILDQQLQRYRAQARAAQAKFDVDSAHRALLRMTSPPAH